LTGAELRPSPRVAYPDAQWLTKLLKELVSIDSCDPPGREIEVAELVANVLRKNHVDATLDEFEPGRANVVARIKGRTSSTGLAYSAHLDTVPIGNQPWKYPPLGAVMVDGRMYGRGSADMKGGLAAMVASALIINNRREKLGGDLILAFTAGESSACLGARRLVEQNALNGATAILVSEPTSLRVVTAEKGAVWLRATANGRTGHVSGATSNNGVGINAIMPIIEFLTKLRNYQFKAAPDQLLGEPTINVGKIHGGVAANVTPDRCIVDFDLRILPHQLLDPILSDLRILAGSTIDISIIDVKPPVMTDPRHPFVKICAEATKAHIDVPTEPLGVAYYSDAAVLAPAFNLAMVIIGPGDLGISGSNDEFVEIDRVCRATKIYTDIALAYLG
jgi:succinyl-diaminopimelate desuccinylase